MKTRGMIAFGGAALAALVASGPAAAVLEATPYVGYRIEHDDNVFRFTDEAEAQTQTGSTAMSDTLQETLVGVESTYRFGKQSLFLNGHVGKTRYNRFEELDYDGGEVEGGLEYDLLSQLTGNITGSYFRGLRDFEDFTGQRLRSIQSTHSVGGTLNYRFFTDYEFRSGYETRRSRNNLPVARDADVDEDVITVGVAYVSPTQFSIGIEGEFLDGEFIERAPPESFDQTTVQVVGSWRPSAISEFTGEFGSTKRQNDAAGVDDFSGITGLLEYRRSISAKTSGGVRLKRNVESVEAQDQDFVVTTGVGVFGEWQPMPNLTLDVQAEHQEEDFRGQPAGFPKRDDDVTILSTGAKYEVGRYLVFLPQLTWEDRSSNVALQEYDAFRVGLEVRLQYPIE